MKYSTSKKGLSAFLSEWEEEVMQVLWQNPEALNSREIHKLVKKDLQLPISRACVYNFLETMLREGVLETIDVTGRGGQHHRYTASLNEKAYKNMWLRN